MTYCVGTLYFQSFVSFQRTTVFSMAIRLIGLLLIACLSDAARVHLHRMKYRGHHRPHHGGRRAVFPDDYIQGLPETGYMANISFGTPPQYFYAIVS
jgi:hypothetical protein